jgi:hypothetical protein
VQLRHVSYSAKNGLEINGQKHSRQMEEYLYVFVHMGWGTCIMCMW